MSVRLNLNISILCLGCSLWFVEGSLNVVKFILEHAEAYHDLIDETAILQITIPVVMSYVFLSLTKHKYSQNVISTCIKVCLFHFIKVLLIQ